MASSDVHDFLFCDLCGTLLYFDSPIHASCPLCGNQRNIKELQGKEIWYRFGAEDIRKHVNLEPFIKVDKGKEVSEEEEIQQRAVVNEECPKCHHPQLEYYTRQLRSADEGQTVFYECSNCRYKFAQNT